MSFVEEMKSTPKKIEISMEYICKCVDTMLDEAARFFVENLKCKIKEIVKTENSRRIERTELTSGARIYLHNSFGFENKNYSMCIFDIEIKEALEITNYDENSEYKLPKSAYMLDYGYVCTFYGDCSNRYRAVEVLLSKGGFLGITLRLRYDVETTETGFIFKKKSTQCIPNELMKRFSSKVSQLALQDGITTEFIHTYDRYYGLRVKHHYIFQY